MKRRGLNNNRKEIMTIVAGFGIVVAVSLGISTVVSNREAQVIPEDNSVIAEENFNQAVSPVDSNQNAPAKTDEVINTEESKEEENATEQEKETAEETEQAEPSEDEDETAFFDEFDELALLENDVVFTWPLVGEIGLDYSNALVYDPTLEQFRTSDSVCILAEEGSDVVAAYDGVVESVTSDSGKGLVVVLSHVDGWSTTYSQLSTQAAVKVGDTVTQGQVIGQIAMPSKYGAALGPHLEFKVTQGSFAIDPKVAVAQ